jgi:hypothetical protein
MNSKLVRVAIVLVTLVSGSLIAGCNGGPETEDSTSTARAARK